MLNLRMGTEEVIIVVSLVIFFISHFLAFLLIRGNQIDQMTAGLLIGKKPDPKDPTGFNGLSQ